MTATDTPWGQVLATVTETYDAASASRDPITWAVQHGVELWSKQRDVMASVRDNRRTAVRAGHGVSKSFTASLLAAWWVTTHRVGEALVVTTAPTQAQVSAILWGELRRLHARLGLPGVIGLDNVWKVGNQIVAIGRKPADSDEVAFQGLHARHVLAILDEAAGLPDPLWDAVAGVVTSDTSRQLAIGNPDSRAGRFYSCFEPGSGWSQVHVPVTESPAFTGEEVSDDLLAVLPSPAWVEDARSQWGENSPQWASRVLGNFPDADDNTLVSWEQIKGAQQRIPKGGLLPIVLSVDVARFGGDSTVIALRTGWAAKVLHSARGWAITETAGYLTKLSRDLGGLPVVVDDTGIGGGVTDLLRENGVYVFPFIGAATSHDPTLFANKRAEGYWRVRQAMESGLLALDPADDGLARQLARQRYSLDSKGRVLIASKETLRAKGEPSPDRSDAISMAFADLTPPGTGSRVFDIG
jgi:hypothetical protein